MWVVRCAAGSWLVGGSLDAGGCGARRARSSFVPAGAAAAARNLHPVAIVLDPGIDFAKQKTDNLRIYRELKSLKHFERPILLPVSRKTVIGDVLGIADPADRDAGTIACVVAGTLRGASIFRVHNVRAVVQALRVIYPIVKMQSEMPI